MTSSLSLKQITVQNPIRNENGNILVNGYKNAIFAYNAGGAEIDISLSLNDVSKQSITGFVNGLKKNQTARFEFGSPTNYITVSTNKGSTSISIIAKNNQKIKPHTCVFKIPNSQCVHAFEQLLKQY